MAGFPNSIFSLQLKVEIMRVLFYIRSVYDNLVGKYAVNTFAYVEDNSLLYKGDIFRSYFVSMEYRFSILVDF
jgi:DNA modification methylase